VTGIAEAIELFNQGRTREVEQICRAVVPGHDGYAQARHLLGLLAYRHGRLDEAEQHLLCAVALRPGEAQFSNHLGCTLCGQGRLDEGIAAYRRALQLNPRIADTHYNLGNALKRKGKLVQAIKCYEQALTLEPGFIEVQQNLANVLRDQGHAARAEKLLARAWRQHPVHAGIGSNYVHNLNYHITDGQRLLEEHLRFAGIHTGLSIPPVQAFANDPDPGRRLRIGYVSADFCRHSVAYFIEPLLRHHRRDSYEVYCYASVPNEDEVTERLAALADVWRNIRHMPDAGVAEQVRRDGVDILVDLAGHTSNHRLLVFARKPAPVQLTYLGYPNTTGLSCIDYRFTDARADPPGNERWHAERLLRLPHGFLCFTAPREAPAVAPPPLVSNGFVTFGCFNIMAKIQPELIELWCTILKAVPASRLLLKNASLADEDMQRQVLRDFRRKGVGANRLILHGRVPCQRDHLALYHQVDIALDTFPYNGTTTSCEALWMGVPVVSLYGQMHASRVGLSLLSCIDLADLAAATPGQCVAVAAALAADQGRLEQLRSGLRSRVQLKLCDAGRFAEQVEDAYRDIWRTWCAGG